MKKWESPIVEELDITMTAGGDLTSQAEEDKVNTGAWKNFLPAQNTTPSSN